MTALWRELRSVLAVGTLTAGVVAAFPISALDFKARSVPVDFEASAAFVRLTAEEEDSVLKAAKTTWQDESSAMQRMRVRLPLGDLPEEDMSRTPDPAAPVGLSSPSPEPIPYRLPAYRPSSAAQPASRLAPEPEVRPLPAFSRDELLQLN